jgi:hypothetical protein
VCICIDLNNIGSSSYLSSGNVVFRVIRDSAASTMVGIFMIKVLGMALMPEKKLREDLWGLEKDVDSMILFDSHIYSSDALRKNQA